MGCMSSKPFKKIEREPVKEIPEISWPTKCYRNPGVLPASLAIGYPFPYPDGYPNTPPPFPIPDCDEKAGLIYCQEVHGLRQRRYSTMEKDLC